MVVCWQSLPHMLLIYQWYHITIKTVIENHHLIHCTCFPCIILSSARTKHHWQWCKTSRTYTITKSWRPILLPRRCILNRVDRFGFSLAHRDLFKRLYNVSDFLSQSTNLLTQLSKQTNKESYRVDHRSRIILHWSEFDHSWIMMHVDRDRWISI